MEWLLALVFVWGSLQDASVNYDEAALAFAALEQEESAMYEDPEAARLAISSEWAVFPETVQQGDAFMVRSNSEQTIAWNGESIKLLPFGTGYYALLPVPSGMKAGSYPIGSTTITINRKSFETQYLEVTEEQEAMRRNTERIQADQVKIDKARSDSADEFLWTDKFVRPAEGRLSTPYGFTRYINGKLSGTHKAIDLAAPEGSPVYATSSGKVVLAEELYLTGNSIYIDHGLSLFSQYAHLSKLLVNPGDEVEAGQLIGLVGTTGFSTGPHLHFAFWLHNVQTNPDLFFDSSPFLWFNKDEFG